MGIFAWIVFGGLAGWVASMLAGRNDQQGCIVNIVVGIVGAFIGGLVMSFLTGAGFNFSFDIRSFIVAVIGAVIFLALLNLARRET